MAVVTEVVRNLGPTPVGSPGVCASDVVCLEAIVMDVVVNDSSRYKVIIRVGVSLNPSP